MKKIQMLFLVALLSVFAFGGFYAFDDKFTTSMTGAAEVPGPGDTDGTGTADIDVNQGQGDVCFEIKVSNIATATLAHIHEAAAGQAGPPVVTLTAPNADGTSKDCVKNVDKELIKRIKDNPANFYVNVHNAEFPDGAIRGQLVKKP